MERLGAKGTAVALMCLLVSGCSGHSSISGPVITNGNVGGGLYAELRGSLALEGNCLTFDGYPVVWPADTTWDAEKNAVVFGGAYEKAASIALDTSIVLGGGLVEGREDSLRDALDDDAYEALTAVGDGRKRGHSDGRKRGHPDRLDG
jgi:hypothetical protein